MKLPSTLCLLLTFFHSFGQGDVTFWTGGLTTTSAILQVGTDSPALVTAFCYHTDTSQWIPSAEHEIYLGGVSHKFLFSNLQPGIKYTFQIVINNDTLSNLKGSFSTFNEDPPSIRFLAGACSESTDHSVYEVMAIEEALFFICMGDIHYRNPKSESAEIRAQWLRESVLQPDAGRKFFRHMPIAYTWDDHDYCGNNSTNQCVGRVHALNSYRQGVPHYPLAFTNEESSIAQAFSVGRIRFIMPDLRSERSEQFIMSIEQKQWLFQELLRAHQKGMMICLISSVPWIGTAADSWSDYPRERSELSDFIRNHKITRLFMLAGDAHMVAADNGVNSDYAQWFSNPTPFPVLHAAALNQTGSEKGGPYSEGTFPNTEGSGQYASVLIRDENEGSFCVDFSGFRVEQGTSDKEELLNYTFCRGGAGILQIDLFPNPASSTFRLIVGEVPVPEKTELIITDLAGRVIYREPVLLKAGSNEFIIEPSHQPASGVYLAGFRYEEQWRMTRITILNP